MGSVSSSTFLLDLCCYFLKGYYFFSNSTKNIQPIFTLMQVKSWKRWITLINTLMLRAM